MDSSLMHMYSFFVTTKLGHSYVQYVTSSQLKLTSSKNGGWQDCILRVRKNGNGKQQEKYHKHRKLCLVIAWPNFYGT